MRAVTNPDGSPNPAMYFWATGVLSSFLDNAPTYLVFLNTELGNFYPGLPEPQALAALLRGFPNLQKVELLPFHKLCLEKYEALGIPFPLKDTPAMPAGRLAALREILRGELPGLCAPG